MRYKFLSLQDSGNGTDFIMAVRHKPNLWQRLRGERPEEEEFFGPHPHWITMNGMIAPHRIECVLDRFLILHRQAVAQRCGAAAWKGIEPNAG